MPPEAAQESMACWIAGASLVAPSAFAPWRITSHTDVGRSAARLHHARRNNSACIRFTVVPASTGPRGAWPLPAIRAATVKVAYQVIRPDNCSVRGPLPEDCVLRIPVDPMLLGLPG